jgi:hypothetical protein
MTIKCVARVELFRAGRNLLHSESDTHLTICAKSTASLHGVFADGGGGIKAIWRELIN